MTVGATIRTLRQRAGLPQNGLAAAAGVSAAYLNDIEFDRRTPTERVIRRLADLLRCDPVPLLLEAGRVAPEALDELTRLRAENAHMRSKLMQIHTLTDGPRGRCIDCDTVVSLARIALDNPPK